MERISEFDEQRRLIITHLVEVTTPDEGPGTLSIWLRMLRERGRDLIWSLCVSLGPDGYGLPGEACRVMELYVSSMCHKLRYLDDNERNKALAKIILPRAFLIAACSIRLAVKMCARRGKATLRLLASINANFAESTIKQIGKTEYDILKAIGFHLPARTTVEIGELLAAELQLSSTVTQIAVRFIHLADFYRPDIDDQVRAIADTQTTYTGDFRIRSLHLAAGGVAAAIKFVQPAAYPGQQLETLVAVPAVYIESIADVILKVTMEPPPKHMPNILRKNCVAQSRVSRRLNFDDS